QHDAFLVGQHAVEGAPHPQDDDQREDDREAGAGAKAAGKDTAQTILAAAQDLFEVGRLRSARPARAAAMAVAATPAAPGTAIAAATAAARPGAPGPTALTVPDHCAAPCRRPSL